VGEPLTCQYVTMFFPANPNLPTSAYQTIVLHHPTNTILQLLKPSLWQPLFPLPRASNSSSSFRHRPLQLVRPPSSPLVRDCLWQLDNTENRPETLVFPLDVILRRGTLRPTCGKSSNERWFVMKVASLT
jgi:hypothetical protein